MGSAQSYVSSELAGTALTGLVIAGAVGLGFTRLNNTSSSSSTHVKSDEGTSAENSTTKKGKKKKQNKSPAGAAASTPTPPPPPQLAYLSNTIPGQFDVNPHQITQDSSAAENLIPKTKKPKRKKTKITEDAPKNLSIIPSDYHSESSSIQQPLSKSRRSPQPQSQSSPEIITANPSSQPLHIATSSPLDTDSSWTQVGSSKRTRKSSILGPPSAESQSEASFTTSAYSLTNPTVLHCLTRGDSLGLLITTQKEDESSPRNTADDDTHDSFLLQQPTLSSWDSQNRKTIAEKLLPDPLKTGVEDMLEKPENPSSSHVKHLPNNDKPAAGFSWADYEDVRVATDGGENDADGEDDGWGVVTSKRPRRINTSSSTGPHHTSQPSLKASETLTKRQRQNVQRREQQKAAKAESETQRLAALANHKRELEKVRIQELLLSSKPSKQPSGGMKATVDQRGNLIWE